MKILKNASEMIDNIISLQDLSNEEYRLMKYVITKQVGDTLLIYNTLTLELVELSEYETRNFVSEKYGEFDYLIQHWYLVKKDFDDYKFYKNVLGVCTLLTQNKDIGNFTVLTTTDCNAHCFYCFENKCEKYTMNDEIAHNVADFIKNTAHGNSISIKWFGGEPLKNISPINIISDSLKKAGIKYSSTIVTNGYYFDKLNARLAKDLWNLKRAQITLDGTKDIYNKIKAYNNGDINPFETVMQNIENLLNNTIKVVIRLNLNEKNKDDLISLVDYLYQRFGNSIEIYSVLIYNKKGNSNPFKTKEKQKAMIRQQTIIDSYILSKGIATKLKSRNSLKLNACMADSENSITILPDGSLGKCDYYIDKDNEYVIGDIYNGIKNFDVQKAFKSRIFFDGLCVDCPILPFCFKIKNCPTSNSEYCDTDIRNYKVNYYRERLETMF